MADIKKAFDQFEADDYVGCKEEIRSYVRDKVNGYLKSELDLKNDVVPIRQEEE